MVRVKTVPGNLFTSGRITMRETTREVIHEVSMGDDEDRHGRGRAQYSVEYPESPVRNQVRDPYDRYNRRQRAPSHSRNYDGRSEYMTEEPSFARPLDKRSRRNEPAEISNAFSGAYQGRNEYMTDDQSYSAYSVGSDRYNNRQRAPSHSRNYNGRSEYMTEEPSFARPLDNRSRRNETAENSNGFSGAYQGRNEYMTDDQGDSAYPMGSRQREDRENTMPSSRLYDSRDEYMKDGKQYSRQEKARNIRNAERIPFQRRQVNEMRDSASVLESARDSSAPSDFTVHRGDADVIPMARQMVDMSTRNKSVADRSLPKAKGERVRQMLQSTSSTLQSGGGGTMDRGDASSVATTSSRRSGGVPRFARTPKQRRKSGVGALLEIRRLQKSVNTLIPKIGLQRVVREVVGELYPNEGYRFTKTALEALQEAAEAALIQAFSDACLCAQHAKRVTLMTRDIQLVRNLQRW